MLNSTLKKKDMTFAKGKNELEASIEDNALLLENIAYDLEHYYSEKCILASKSIENIKSLNIEEDLDILTSILRPEYQLLELYQELHVQTLQLLVPKVYSFAEKHIEGLLERLSYTIKKAKIEYDKDFGSKSQCISLIEKGCYIICKHCDLLYDKQMSTWNGFKDFHAVRKTIVHRYNMDVKNINIEYIRRNIEAAKKLLLSLEYATRRP